MQSTTRLAHKNSLSVCCLFSISFVWILGARVICFKVKTRQRDQKKRKKSGTWHVNSIWQQARGDGHLAQEGGRGRQRRTSRVWKGEEQA